MGELHRLLVVVIGASLAVAGVGLDEQVEQGARRRQPTVLALQRSAVAETLGRDDHWWVEPGADVVEPGTQLAVGVALVGVDERTDELRRLDHHLGGEILPGQRREVVLHCLDEGVDLLAELPGHPCDRTGPHPPTRVPPHSQSIQSGPVGGIRLGMQGSRRDGFVSD